MPTAAFRHWDADGRPYRDATPNADLAHNVARHGYTVFTKGDDPHMEADPPEDHTPFSATGWPVRSAYPVGHAHDIMPPTKPGLPSLARLARQIIADKNAGVPGTEAIKYINWTDENGNTHQDSWTPDHEHGDSDDTGHIHISVRSDMDTRHTTYDPVARALGDDDMTPAQQKKYDDTAFIARNALQADGVKRGRVDFAVDDVRLQLLALKKTVSELAGRPPVTPEELARIVTAAEFAARSEVGAALRAAGDAVDTTA